MESKTSSRLKVIRVWRPRVLGNGALLYVPHYIVVAT
jgi:hypothetical protein